MIARKSPGNNRFFWSKERLETLAILRNTGKTKEQIADAMQCYDISCVTYGIRKLEGRVGHA